MQASMTVETLKNENVAFQGSGGVSGENRGYGFRPGFQDTETQAIYVSRFADGRAAPFHILDGLPDAVVLSRDVGGRVVAAKSSLVSGFVLNGEFYTREAAEKWLLALH